MLIKDDIRITFIKMFGLASWSAVTKKQNKTVFQFWIRAVFEKLCECVSVNLFKTYVLIFRRNL